MASTRTSLPCHSAGRNGSGGAWRMTAQQVSSSGAVSSACRYCVRTSRRRRTDARQALRDLRTKLVELEIEDGDDAEIAAAAAQRPEQVRVLRRARAQQLAVGRDHVGETQIVDCQAEPPGDPAEAAAKRQAGDSGGRVDAVGTTSPKACVSLSRSASVAPGSTQACRVTVSTRTDFIGDRSIIRPPSQSALPAMLWPPPRTATRRLLSRAKLTALTTSAATGAAHDQAGPAVDHRIPDSASGVVFGVAGQQHHGASQGASESGNLGFADRHGSGKGLQMRIHVLPPCSLLRPDFRSMGGGGLAQERAWGGPYRPAAQPGSHALIEARIAAGLARARPLFAPATRL